ncbi:MAG TPA: hypothetical protein VG125_33235 [Pirellulales bacterium]|jgi:hypothetical protein|nr:hypothetical protein [Pirellulales bacterium]
MSEIRLVLRDAARALSGTCHGSTADQVIAALSAEPETIEELDLALDRFCQRRDGQPYFAWFRAGLAETPHDAGVMIVDLAARLIACESTYSSPLRRGTVLYHDGQSGTNLDVGFHLPDDWTILSEVSCWQSRAEELRRQRLSESPLETRAVLYGQPLLQFIASACFGRFGQAGAENAPLAPAENDADQDGDRYHDPDYDAIREIHARWLMTLRDDLRGQSPRDVLFAKQDFLSRDMQDRETQWSFQERCPPTLDRASHAYRFAGIGTHEWVNYYDLLRHLLWSCHDQVRQQTKRADWPLLSSGDFLTTEIPRLEGAREDWLDTPNRELGRTPREVNDNERRRMPVAMSAHDAVIDDDCPLCQMMADGLGLMFWHLDGCNMDDEFAFSHFRTREEWEEQQRQWEEMSRHFDAKQETEKELAIQNPGGGYAHPDMVWQRSFSSVDSQGEPLELRLFSVGSHLAEIIADLKRPPEDRPLIDALKRDFGNLREVARSGDLAHAAALVEPVLDRFCETLAEVAASHADLARRTTALESRLRRFAEPPSESGDGRAFDAGGESFDDDDIPFDGLPSN